MWPWPVVQTQEAHMWPVARDRGELYRQGHEASLAWPHVARAEVRGQPSLEPWPGPGGHEEEGDTRPG